MPGLAKSKNIVLVTRAGYHWRAWYDSRGRMHLLNQIAPVGSCIRP